MVGRTSGRVRSNMAAKTSKVAELLEAFDYWTEEDLAELDGQIADTEKRLDGLRQVRKLVAMKLGIVPEKMAKTPAAEKKPRAAAGGGPTVADRCLQYIAKNGPERTATLAEKLGISYQAVYGAVKGSPWFDVQSDGVHLSASGHSQAKLMGGGK